MTDAASMLPPILPALQAFAFKLARNAPDAEDLVQLTCEQALRNAAKYFVRGQSFKSWCFGIMQRQHIDAWRSKARREPHHHAIAEMQSGSYLGAQEPSVLLNEVWRAGERIGCDMDLLLEDASGATINELCARHGAPSGTIKSRLSRTRKALRAELQWGAA